MDGKSTSLNGSLIEYVLYLFWPQGFIIQSHEFHI